MGAGDHAVASPHAGRNVIEGSFFDTRDEWTVMDELILGRVGWFGSPRVVLPGLKSPGRDRSGP